VVPGTSRKTISPWAVYDHIPARMSAIVDIIVYVIGLAPIDADAIVGRQARDYRLPGRRDVTRFLHNCPLWRSAYVDAA
jgi:hypothetical protein